MAGLDEGTVDFKPTYNGEEEEPEVFPGLFPNLLANGASGIAVGMATSIPPHNVGELIDAAVAADRQSQGRRRGADGLRPRARFPDRRRAGRQPRSRSPRPMRPGAAASACAPRSRSRREKGGGWHLLVSEMPYGVQKGRLIEQIAALIADKKLPILADVRDESDEQVRVVLEPRSRTVDPQLLLESLYRLTDLEIRFPLNLNVLDANRTPGVMSLKQALTAWLAFQIEVLLNRSRTRIGKIDERLELLDGFLIAFLNLDRVIAIIRTEDEPKPVLIAEFALNDRQAEAILNMRLRQLRRLEEMEIAKEREALAKEREELAKLVESPARQRTRLKKRPGRGPREVRRRAADADRGSQRDARDRLVGDDREGADHRHPVAARLDPGDERPCRARGDAEPEMARGRRAVRPFPRPDHRPAGAVRRQWPGLHAGRRQIARRARLRRAGAAADRPRRRGRDRRR